MADTLEYYDCLFIPFTYNYIILHVHKSDEHGSILMLDDILEQVRQNIRTVSIVYYVNIFMIIIKMKLLLVL